MQSSLKCMKLKPIKMKWNFSNSGCHWIRVTTYEFRFKEILKIYCKFWKLHKRECMSWKVHTVIFVGPCALVRNRQLVPMLQSSAFRCLFRSSVTRKLRRDFFWLDALLPCLNMNMNSHPIEPKLSSELVLAFFVQGKNLNNSRSQIFENLVVGKKKNIPAVNSLVEVWEYSIPAPAMKGNPTLNFAPMVTEDPLVCVKERSSVAERLTVNFRVCGRLLPELSMTFSLKIGTVVWCIVRSYRIKLL